jgi:hypothetical protein
MQLGDDGVYACLRAHELEVGPDGRFEILLSRERPAGHGGNFLALHPDARYVQIRQYFADWERESPASFEIQQLGNEGRPPEPLTPARMAAMLDDAGEWVDVTARFWAVGDQMRRAQPRSSPRAFAAAPTTSSTATTCSCSGRTRRW